MQVDAHDEVPVVSGDVHERLPACHPGVRDECVETTEALDSLGDERLVLLGARDIGANERRAAAERLDLSNPPGGLVDLRDVIDRDVETVFRQHEGNAPADAPSRLHR